MALPHLRQAGQPTLVAPSRLSKLRIGFLVVSAFAFMSSLAHWATLLEAPVLLCLSLGLALIPAGILITFYTVLTPPTQPHRYRAGALAFAWGMIGAAGIAVFGNSLAEEFVSRNMVAVLMAPLNEELAKGLFLLLLFLLTPSLFYRPLQGLILGGLAGTGFAFTENVTYLVNAYLGSPLERNGLGALFETFIARSTSLMLHPLLTSLVGLGLALALQAPSRRQAWIRGLGGLLLAIGLHMMWNGSIVHQSVLFFGVLFFIFIPLCIGYTAYGWVARRREPRLFAASLQELVVLNVIPAAQAYWLSTPQLQRSCELLTYQQHGEEALLTWRSYQHHALELVTAHQARFHGAGRKAVVAQGNYHFTRLTGLLPYLQPVAPQGLQSLPA